MGAAHDAATVALAPEPAFELWTDLSRWATFVDGFGHVDRVDDSWPAEGAKLVWRSGPSGRGTVTERVVASELGARLVTQVYDERMSGTQAVRFTPAEGGSRVDLELEYTLNRAGPLAPITDLLFIRRAQLDSLRRTLRRFATEAAEEAAM
jgi:Polyketide cyclase / dehydrase and lipid transport